MLNFSHMKEIIIITGAGGTVGMSLVKFFLKTHPSTEIRAIERSEIAASQLIDLARDNKNLKVFLADLINYPKTEDIMAGSHTVIHCAALKHVRVGSLFPDELARQNVNCFCNVASAAKKHKIRKVLLCSSDKASTPTSVMGASKLLLEKIACFSSDSSTKFATVRFGNILNSSGSIIPKIISRLASGETICLNHKDMTRYILTESEFLNLIDFSLVNMQGGEIFIPKARSVKISDLVEILIEKYYREISMDRKDVQVSVLGNPYVENINERMLNPDEVEFSVDAGKYVILNTVKKSGQKPDAIVSTSSGILCSSRDNISKKEIDSILDGIIFQKSESYK